MQKGQLATLLNHRSPHSLGSTCPQRGNFRTPSPASKSSRHMAHAHPFSFGSSSSTFVMLGSGSVSIDCCSAPRLSFPTPHQRRSCLYVKFWGFSSPCCAAAAISIYTIVRSTAIHSPSRETRATTGSHQSQSVEGTVRPGHNELHPTWHETVTLPSVLPLSFGAAIGCHRRQLLQLLLVLLGRHHHESELRCSPIKRVMPSMMPPSRHRLLR